MRLLFAALVRPHLEFGNVWSPHFQKDKKLISVLRRATKLVPGLGNRDYSERLKSMNLPSMIKYRRERGDMIDIQVHAWPIHYTVSTTVYLGLYTIQCQPQSICIGHCNNNKRTQIHSIPAGFQVCLFHCLTSS